ncbi:MAG: zinc ribbon domain-containing protein [Lachnospiraceae bacterium]|nr:zinc ribbon domain-containing protein [Lachnospiraceae bacterium]
MFCKNCGNQLKDSASFCPKCGWKKEQAPAPTPPVQAGPGYSAPAQNVTVHTDRDNERPPQKHNLAIVLAVIFGVLLIAGGVTAFIIFRSKDKNPDEDINTVAEEPVEDPEEDPAEDVPVSDEAIKQLKDIIAQADEYAAVWESVDFEDMQASMDATEQFYNELYDLTEQIKAIKGLPANVSGASVDAFSMYMTAMEALYKNYIVLNDLMALADSIKADNDIIDNFNSFVDQYDAISCPDNLKDSWDKIGKSIDSFATAIIRSDESSQLNDNLRMASADNHFTRFGTVLENEISFIVGIVEEELEFALDQVNTGDEIFSELESVLEMPREEMEAHVFNYDIDNVLSDFAFDHVDVIYPSLYNTYSSFVTVKTGCISGSRDITITCEIPELSQSVSQDYHIGPALTVINIKPPAASGRHNLDSAWDTQIRLSIKDKKDGSSLSEQSFRVHIASRNDFMWESNEFGVITQDNILCFLSPDSKAITDLKRNSIDLLSNMTQGTMSSLAGYQGPYYLSDDSDGDGQYDNEVYAEAVTTYLQAAALMRELSEMGVRYTNDAFSIDNADQHILFPDQVLENKTGLCIETSLVIASALQSMGMHTFLVFPPGHAQVAVETWNGSGMYFLIETTAIPNTAGDFVDDANHWLSEEETTDWDNAPIAFYSSDNWAEYLKDSYVIDCSDGAMLGLTPFSN